MIELTKDKRDFLRICDKVKETRDCRIKPDNLFNIMLFNKVDTYISYEKDELTGCTLLTLQPDMAGEKALFIIYMFIDKHYPELSIDYMKFIERRAKDLKAKKISFTTHRNPKAIERKYSKYGYKHRCSVIEKILNDEEVI